MSLALVKRPETIQAELLADEDRQALFGAATAELLAGIEEFITRYVVLPSDAASVVAALYVLHTWALDACDATPYVVIVSAEKGSGKTRALEVLELLVRNPWHTAKTTEVAMFRKISQDCPTVLLDELDTIFRGGVRYEALRAILNAGNRRGSTVTRCDGNYGTREYETFGPKVMAGIDTGFIPDTILDRSIVIRMRKRTTEEVMRLRVRLAEQEVGSLAASIQTWGMIATPFLATREPDLPSCLSDRGADAWEPLLAIAEFAGAQWTARAHMAAAELSATEPAETDDAPRTLLPALEAAMFGPTTIKEVAA